MQVTEAIQHRCSIRHFEPDPVPSTHLREMLALAMRAPNVGNRQMWRFIIVTDASLRQMLARLVRRKFDEMVGWLEFNHQEQRLRAIQDYALSFEHAPAVIFIVNTGYRQGIEPQLTEHGLKTWEIANLFMRPDIQSIGALIGYLTLLAEERGYGSCWITDALLAKADLQATLDIPSNEELIALLAIGKPAGQTILKERRPVDELIKWR